MSKVFAVVKDNIVINLVLWTGVTSWDYNVDGDIIEVPEGTNCSIGYSYINGTFVSPDTYQDIEVLVSKEVRGEVQELVSPAEFNEYGEEVSPALYVFNPNGIISPAVYETLSILINPSESSGNFVEIAQDIVNRQSLDYLQSTDWMVIRESEGGAACPAEVRAERAAARARIVR